MDTFAASSRCVRLALHGYPRITIDGRAHPLRLKHGMALLAYLCRRAQPVGRDMLAALLWPDARPGVGRARLRRLVHQLHGALGPGVVHGDAHALWLADSVHSDLQRTQAAIEAADGRVLCEPQAAGLLDGFTLDSDAFEDWLDAERRVLRAALARALERAIDAALAAQDADTAERAGAALLRLEPCAEAGHIARMAGRAAHGDVAAVEQAYFEAARLWRAEFGLRPSARIEAAYAQAPSQLLRGHTAPSIVVMWNAKDHRGAGLDAKRLRAMFDRVARRHRVVVIERQAAQHLEFA